MRRHVCLFTSSLEPSGVGEQMLALAAGLRADHDVTLAAIPHGPGAALLTRARTLGARVLALDGRGHRRDPEIVRLRAWLRSQRVDLFHLHAGIGWEGHTATHAAREAGVPVVLRTEHLPFLLDRVDEQASYLRLLPAVDRLICVSAGVAASLIAAGVPAEKLCTIRNGITPRPPAVARNVVRRALGIRGTAVVCLTVARLTEQKGHRLLLDAVPAVAARCPDAAFVWVGEGPLHAELHERVRRQGLNDRVRFLGHCDDVPSLLAAADLLILPSAFEGLPLVALEAMAAGLPVIGTHVCGTSEVVAHRVSGLLTEPGDARGLARALIEAITQPGRAAAWGAAGASRYAREFTAARMVRETAALYQELLGRDREFGHRGAEFGEAVGPWAKSPGTELA